MTNDEIKELLRDLAAKADAAGEVKSKTVRINFSKPEPVKENSPADDEPAEEPEEGEAEETAADTEVRPDRTERSLRRKEKAASEEGDEAEEEPDEGDTGHAGKERRTRGGLFKAMSEKLGSWRARRKIRKDVEEGLSDAPISDLPEELAKKLEDEDREETESLPLSHENPEEFVPETEEEDEPILEPGGTSETTLRVLEEMPSHDNILEKEKKDHRRKRRSDSQGREKREHAAEERKSFREAPDFDSDASAFRDTDQSQAEDEEQIKKTQNGVKRGVHQLLRSLRSKGIGRRELLMICGGVLLLLIILFIVLGILNNKRKSANVTADEGLHITVEKEPSSWCTGGSVTLKIRSDSPIQTVTVNDVPTEISGETTTTQITLDADTDVLQVMVVTEDNVKNAVVNLKKVDREDPRIQVSAQDGKITLDVTDNKSGVAGIWYGIKEPTIEEAAYVAYTEPFEPEKGKFYSYFARDNAGNVTEPVVTNLTPAEKLVLDTEQIALFPGETSMLQVKTEPVNAFTNGLVMESADPGIAAVDERGVITAMADGETDITVSAQELAPVSVHVLVRTSAEFTISAVGDITLGEDVSFSPLTSFSTVQTMHGNSYFFDNVRDIFEADDVTFGNFEGTLTTSSTRMDKQFAFRGDPSYAQILVDGSVEAVTLANNHSSDYGEGSLTDTQNYLTEAGIEWCSGDKIILKDYNGVKTALIGIYVLAEGEAKAAQVESTIAEAKNQGAQLIVVAFHWGNERETKPDSVQTSLAHLAIDSGADLVVGHHPHVLQGIEKYSGKYICYSLANFCFGGNSNPSDTDTMIFQQTFEVLRGGEIRSGEASVIPCSVSSEPGWNNYQPTPAQGEEKERIMARINELCEPFGTSF